MHLHMTSPRLCKVYLFFYVHSDPNVRKRSAKPESLALAYAIWIAQAKVLLEVEEGALPRNCYTVFEYSDLAENASKSVTRLESIQFILTTNDPISKVLKGDQK